MTRRFTGRHMLAAMLGFFGVVIAVNMTMATLAARTFGGTVVDNSYVAGQRFNRWLDQGRAQERLGWRTEVSLDAGRRVRLRAGDRDGPLAGAQVEAVAGHPLGRAPDVALAFAVVDDGVYAATTPLPPGRWTVHLEIRQGRRSKRLIETLS